MGKNFSSSSSESETSSRYLTGRGEYENLRNPYSVNRIADGYKNSKGGVWDITNYIQFTPYESGYCFLAVLNSPRCMRLKESGASHFLGVDCEGYGTTYNALLQDAFVKMLENEFRGLDGIDDITSETIDITDNISTMSLISKINLQSNGTFTMRFTEKSGSLITKYISRYLKCIRDPKTRAKTYNGLLNSSNLSGCTENGGGIENPGLHYEVFNFLYVITDATCLRVEKAFLILNAQPTTAAYSELYNVERGNIEVKELSVPFNGFVVDGKQVNKIGADYVKNLVNLTTDYKKNKINLNSENFGYSINGVTIGENSGKTGKITNVKFE